MKGLKLEKENECGKCNKWKPERAHHCRICERCVLIMDHHCPWMGNCVGYHNLKPFFLYCFFSFMAFVNYLVVLIDREFISKENKNSFSKLGELCFWFALIVEIPMCLPLINFSFDYFISFY